MGDIYGGVRPDPIPNSEVKTVRADDTTAHAAGKVGSCPLMKDLSLNLRSFFVSLKTSELHRSRRHFRSLEE